ncbi:MAG: DNA alkylation repair protein [Myxococcota bacterium]
MHGSEALEALRAMADEDVRQGFARFAIPTESALGVTMPQVRALARRCGRSHALARELWSTEIHEARLLAALVDEPAAVTVRQMNAWAADFADWSLCDTACFSLFDRTPHALGRIDAWSKGTKLYVKRAAFATLWGLARHDKGAPDDVFLQLEPVLRQGALDQRDHVQKAVDMAMRTIGCRNAALHAFIQSLAKEFVEDSDPERRVVGKRVLRKLRSPRA